jgi:hypothetical protein
LQAKDKDLRTKLANELKNLGYSTKNADNIAQLDLFNQNTHAEWFDAEWMFGLKTGFDIVIGNPPYVQVPKGIYSREQFPYSEGKDKGKQNLYKVFTEQSYNLIKENGIATMIVQSSLMADLSSQYTRELLLTKTQIREILEFPKKSANQGGQVFENVLQGTCIYAFKKTMPTENATFKVSINNDVTTIRNFRYETLQQNELIKFYPNGYFIPLLKPNEFQIVRQMQKVSVPLKSFIVEKTQGDMNQTTNKDGFSDVQTDVKLVRGRNIHRYFIDYHSTEFLKTNFKTEKVKMNENNKYLVCQRTTGTVDKHRLHFAVTQNFGKYLFNEHSNKILLKDIEPEFVMGLLNSSLLDWYFRKTSTNNEVNGYEIEQLPIPSIPPAQQPIISLVNEILTLKKSNQPTEALEKEIDMLVYGLYGLSEEEIGVIETNN